MLLWQLGDMWADLSSFVEAPVTVVTANGTATLLNAGEGWSCRVPLNGGHTLVGDSTRVPLATIAVATSCGLVIRGDTADSARMTTNVALVIEGLHSDWQKLARWPLDGTWNVAGHPERPCGAAYCVVDELLRSAR